jgi:ribosomal protein L29
MKPIKAEEFRSLHKEQLDAKIDELRRKQLELRLQIVAQHVANHATVKKVLRKAIACALTIRHQLQEEGGYER